ncbi:MAG: SRPBCC family protein [Rhodobacterales bacterium]|nr:SRPBCC family protein [Rhodobacterales bacterium]
MDLNGNVFVALPPDRVAPALTDPEMLRRMLPGCPGLEPAGPGRWRAPMERDMGPLTLRLTADLTMQAVGPNAWRLTAQGGTMISGKVSAGFDITLEERAPGTRMTYAGTIEASGLAGKMLASREESLRNYVRNMFGTLVGELEAAARNEPTA